MQNPSANIARIRSVFAFIFFVTACFVVTPAYCDEPIGKTIEIGTGTYEKLKTWLEEHKGKPGTDFPLETWNDDIFNLDDNVFTPKYEGRQLVQINVQIGSESSNKAGYIVIVTSAPLTKQPPRDVAFNWQKYFAGVSIVDFYVSNPVVLQLNPKMIEDSQTFTLQASKLGTRICYKKPGDDMPEICYVAEGSVAEKAGLVVGDKLSAVDGVSIKGVQHEAVFSQIGGMPGTTINLTVLHDGKARNLAIVREAPAQ